MVTDWQRRKDISEAKQRLSSGTPELAREKMLKPDRDPADIDAAIASAQDELRCDDLVERAAQMIASERGEPLGTAGRIAWLLERGACDADEAARLDERASRIAYQRAQKTIQSA